MQGRPYQEEAKASIFRTFEEGAKSTLAVMPTGTGKTVLFGLTARDWIKAHPDACVLALAHREELVFQAADKLKRICDEPVEIEMGEFKASTSATLEGFGARIFVASVQTLGSRLHKFHPHRPWLVIVDEAHHCIPRNKTYWKIVEHFRACPDVRLLGVTATPDRADEEALGKTFETVAFEYSIVAAVNDGWLTPITQKMIIVNDLDLSNVSSRAGDLSVAELDAIINQEKLLHQIVDPTIRIAAGRPTLVFAPGVSSAHAIAEIFNRHATAANDSRLEAVAIDGNTPRDERRHQLRRYSRGEFGVLVGCDVFTEGFDCDRVGVVAMGRPTKSRSLYAQMIGRGTRTLAETNVDQYGDDFERREAIAWSTKPCVDILDFVGDSGKHKLIYAADILGGDEDDEVVELAKAKAKARSKARGDAYEGYEPDVLADLAAARLELDEKKRQQRKGLLVSAFYEIKTVDPFALLDVSPGRERGYLRGKLMTSQQRSLLITAGVQNLEGMTQAKASKLIDEVQRRKRLGLAMPRQLALLKVHGLGDDPAMTYDAAAVKIKELNGRLNTRRNKVQGGAPAGTKT